MENEDGSQSVFPSRVRHGSVTEPSRACFTNRPRSIYQYSNMAPRLSGQTSIFGVVFFVSKSPLGMTDKRNLKILQF